MEVYMIEIEEATAKPRILCAAASVAIATVTCCNIYANSGMEGLTVFRVIKYPVNQGDKDFDFTPSIVERFVGWDGNILHHIS